MAKYAVSYDGIKSLYDFANTVNNISFSIYIEYANLLSTLIKHDILNPTQKGDIVAYLGAIADNCLSAKNVSNKIFEVASAYRELLENDFLTSKSKSKSAERHIEYAQKGAMATTMDDQIKREYALKWIKRRKEVIIDAKKDGKSEEELKQLLEEAELELRTTLGYK